MTHVVSKAVSSVVAAAAAAAAETAAAAVADGGKTASHGSKRQPSGSGVPDSWKRHSLLGRGALIA